MATIGQPYNPTEVMLTIGDVTAGAFDEALQGVVVHVKGAGNNDVDPQWITEADSTGKAHFTLKTWIRVCGPIASAVNPTFNDVLSAEVTHYIFDLISNTLKLTSGPWTPKSDGTTPNGRMATPPNDNWAWSESEKIDLEPGTYRVLTVMNGTGFDKDLIAAFQDGSPLKIMPYEAGTPGYV